MNCAPCDLHAGGVIPAAICKSRVRMSLRLVSDMQRPYVLQPVEWLVLIEAAAQTADRK